MKHKNFLFHHNDWFYIVVDSTFRKAKYRLFRYACGNGYQGTFKQFLKDEFEYKGTIDDNEAQHLIETEEAEWV